MSPSFHFSCMATACNELEIVLYASVKYIYNFPFTFVKWKSSWKNIMCDKLVYFSLLKNVNYFLYCIFRGFWLWTFALQSECNFEQNWFLTFMGGSARFLFFIVTNLQEKSYQQRRPHYQTWIKIYIKNNQSYTYMYICCQEVIMPLCHKSSDCK